MIEIPIGADRALHVSRHGGQWCAQVPQPESMEQARGATVSINARFARLDKPDEARDKRHTEDAGARR